MRDPRKDFTELIGADRVEEILLLHCLNDNYYVIWLEQGLDRFGEGWAVHVFSYNPDPQLMRSGEYRLNLVDALRLVVDLLNGVSV